MQGQFRSCYAYRSGAIKQIVLCLLLFCFRAKKEPVKCLSEHLSGSFLYL